jgi:hypothetical protein
MAPEGSPIVALAQQGVEVTNHVTDQMIRQNVPEVKQHLKPVAIGAWLTTTHDGG